MGTSGGPNVKRDGLVLFLDTPTKRSFRGEPTTNVVTNWNLDTGWSKGYTEDIVFNEIPPPRGVNAPTVGFRNDDTSGDGYWYSYGNYAPQDSSTTYTISVYAKTNQTDNRFFLRAYTANNSENGRHWTNGIYLTAADGWKRIVWPSFTTISNNESDSLSFRYDNLYQDGYTRLWLCAPQMEANTKATRFVKGTRGTTVATGGGWRDISGNNNHGEILNGVTTDNDGDIDGALDFDGTDDYVPITNVLNSQSIGTSTQLTISLWLNLGSKGSRMAFSTGQTGNDRIYYWTQNGLNTWRVGNYTSTTGHTSLPSNGVWYHTAIVIDGLNVTGYFNGKEDYTGTYSAFTTVNYATLGRHGAANSYYYDGKIANVQIYEKALTSGEMLRNYKAVKSRYGL